MYIYIYICACNYYNYIYIYIYTIIPTGGFPTPGGPARGEGLGPGRGPPFEEPEARGSRGPGSRPRVELFNRRLVRSPTHPGRKPSPPCALDAARADKNDVVRYRTDSSPQARYHHFARVPAEVAETR